VTRPSLFSLGFAQKAIEGIVRSAAHSTAFTEAPDLAAGAATEMDAHRPGPQRARRRGAALWALRSPRRLGIRCGHVGGSHADINFGAARDAPIRAGSHALGGSDGDFRRRDAGLAGYSDHQCVQINVPEWWGTAVTGVRAGTFRASAL
jgi:hypothetical protein